MTRRKHGLAVVLPQGREAQGEEAKSRVFEIGEKHRIVAVEVVTACPMQTRKCR